MGPSGPSMETYRRRLPKQYKLRWYPDITHIVRCQYPIPWLDPAWGVTIGREPVNPRPVDYAAIYHNDYRLTDGFLSYSDGIHDDFNKNLWTQLGWEPDRPVHEIAAEYARFFFRPDMAEVGADAILALETNLRGSVAENGSIDGTLRLWQQIEQRLIGSADQLAVRHAPVPRLLRRLHAASTDLRDRPGKAGLAEAGEASRSACPPALQRGPRNSRADHDRAPANRNGSSGLRRWPISCSTKIGYQTSVPKYHGSGFERGLRDGFRELPAQ